MGSEHLTGPVELLHPWTRLATAALSSYSPLIFLYCLLLITETIENPALQKYSIITNWN